MAAGIPVIVCPFPLRVHPDVDLIEAEANRWAAQVGLPGYEPTQIGWLGAACHPDGELDRVLVATNVLHWIFAFDDYVDELAAGQPWRSARQALLSVRVVEDPEHPVELADEPCLVALDDIGRRLRTMATPAQYHRFVTGLTEWVFGEVCGVLAGATTTPRDYPTRRRYNTNGLLSYGLIDLVAGVELPEDVWRRPDVMSLTRLATEIMGYSNDVHSWVKENALDPDAVHLPSVLAREHQVPLAEGVVRAAEHVNGLYTRFQDMAATLRSIGPPVLGTYLTGLEPWLAGQHHWNQRTHRYPTSERS